MEDIIVNYASQFPAVLLMKSKLNILYLNIRSIRNKLNDLTNYLCHNLNNIHIVILNETWLSEYEIEFYQIPHYSSFHSTREKVGGGVSIYVLKSFTQANELESFEFDNCNFLVVELEYQKIKISTAYRPPDANITTFVDKLDQCLEKYQNMFFFGDTNINLFEESNPATISLKSKVLNNGYVVLNSENLDMYTRRNRSDKTPTCIDHVFCDLRAKLSYNFYVDEIPSLRSDHRAILLASYSTVETQSKKSNYIVLKKTNHRNIIENNLLDCISSCSFESFLLELQSTLKAETKETRIKERFRKPFMNLEILNFMTIRDNYRKLFLKYRTNLTIRERFKKYRNKVVELVRKSQRINNDKILSENMNDSRKIWKHMNNILRNRDAPLKESCNALKIDEKSITNRIDIADKLNLYFVQVAEEIKSVIIADQNFTLRILNEESYDEKCPFRDTVCSEDEIKKAITLLKSSDATDFYGISNNTLKLHKSSLSLPLSKLINQSMSTGDFPEALKIAIVKPIFKGGDKTKRQNYRPISILPIVSKIYESIILSRLTTHIKSNNIVSDNQFGFVTNSNTEAAVLHLLSQVYSNIEEKKITAVLFIDFQKAFDCVNHNTLLSKLKKLHLSKIFISILDSFLNERKQCVDNNNVLSSFRKITAGVPQGSILGPTCFLLYINSMSKLKLNGKLQLYADDCAIVYGEMTETLLKQKMEIDLSTIQHWMNAHSMSINASKTNYVLFHGRKKMENFTQHALNIKYGSTIIERKEYVKYLGLFIDELLNFKVHLKHVGNKIRPMSFAIRRIRHRISDKMANQLYFGHIYSHLIFLNPLWSAANANDLDELFIIQKKALKAIHKKDLRTPTNELFTEKILPLPVINDYHLLILAFKIKHNLIKNNVQIRYIRDLHTRETRRQNDFYIYPYETKFGYADFYCRGLVKYNELNENLKRIQTISIFKTRLKEYLYSEYATEN